MLDAGSPDRDGDVDRYGSVTDYFPFLAFELREAGAADLADQLWSIHHPRLTTIPDNLQEIVDTAIRLGCGLGATVDLRWRLLRMLEDQDRSFDESRCNQLETLVRIQDRFIAAKQEGDIPAMRQAQAEFDKLMGIVRTWAKLTDLLDLLVVAGKRSSTAPR